MDKKMLTRMVKPYWRLIPWTIGSLLIFSGLGLLMPWLLRIVIDRVVGAGDLQCLALLLAVMVLIYLIRELFFYISHYLIFYVSQRIMFDIRSKLFKHLQSLSLKFYEEYRTGKLISNVLQDSAMLQQMFTGAIVQLAVNMFALIFILCVLFAINPMLSLLALVVLPLQLMNFVFFKNIIKKDTHALREKMSEISANLAETINGVKVVKSFSSERRESRRFTSSLRPAFNMTIAVQIKGVVCWIFADFLNAICLIATIGLSALLVSRGSMTLGEFVAFYAYLGMMLGPIAQLSNLSTAISQGMAGGERIMKLLNTIPEIKECENPIRTPILTGRIEFRDVVFSYDEKKVLDNFTLTIAPGEKVAFVGPSGSGKTTVANLLLRFYDVCSGSVNVDGTDIRKFQMNSYRDQIGVVLQEPFLFSGTIAENIAYGKSDASVDDIIEAARLANVAEFVDKLDHGYDTVIGENGATLSGGQKQRIAIARAILKRPRLLVLDEATSALDTMSESLVQEALDNLMNNRTTLIIAHRLSTIRNAEKIVVLKDGKMVQIGRHEELIAQPGVYREMYQQQKRQGNEPTPVDDFQYTLNITQADPTTDFIQWYRDGRQLFPRPSLAPSDASDLAAAT